MTCTVCTGTGTENVPGEGLREPCKACGGSGQRVQMPTGEYLAIVARSWPDSAMHEPRATIRQLTEDVKRAAFAYNDSQSVADRNVLEAAEKALADFTVFYATWHESH